MTSTVRTVVTIGAGQTAAVAARTLRRRGFDGRIVLVGDEAHAPYQRPPLSKEYLSGEESKDSLMLLPESWRQKNDIELRTGTSATRIDASGGRVELADGSTIEADAFLIATGGSPRTMAVTGTDPDRAHYLRSIDDAERLSSRLRPGAHIAVLGGGFVGLEIASTAKKLGCHVTVLERQAIPLARIVGSDMGTICTELHRDNGINVRTGVEIAGVHTTPSEVRITLRTGEVVTTDAVVIGIGIVPNVDIATASGLTVDGGITVDAQGRTSIPNIYAAGDVASRYSDSAGCHVRVEHFDNASRQGSATANLILGRTGISDAPHWFWSDQFGVNIQFTGHADYDSIITRGSVEDREFTAFYLRDGIVRGAFALDRSEDIGAARELIGRRCDPHRLHDVDADLFDLLDDEELAVTS